jgi:hypothetical protein
MKPGEAVMKLTALGYRFEAAGERLRWRFEGQGQPDPDQVRPLLQLLKECRGEVLFFLRFYCQKCGGTMFIPDLEGRDLCAACDWDSLIELYPGLKNNSGLAGQLVKGQQAGCNHRGKGQKSEPKTEKLQEDGGKH